MARKYLITALLVTIIYHAATISTKRENGWIPLRKEDVPNNIKKEYSRTYFNTNFGSQDRRFYSHIREIGEKAIKLITPQNLIPLGHEDSVISSTENVNDSSNIYKCKTLDCKESFKDNSKNILPKEDNYQEDNISQDGRKGSQFTETEINENVSNTINNRNSRKLKLLEEKVKRDYNVTEDSIDLVDNQNDNGYPYSYKPFNITKPIDKAKGIYDEYLHKLPIKPTVAQEISLTDQFEKLLSKYEIREDDNLQNYLLSRQPKFEIPKYMLLPIPVQHFKSFNGFHHSPVDPTIAVLLSNYGYYLPGLYGIRNKYRNLYGYLASNNNHNNKPFGSYKIFSDTDSSH